MTMTMEEEEEAKAKVEMQLAEQPSFKCKREEVVKKLRGRKQSRRNIEHLFFQPSVEVNLDREN